MQQESSSGIWEWQIVRLIIFGSLGLFSSFLVWKGFTETGLRWIIRWSIKIDVLCFFIAFGASGFHQLMQNSFSFWLYMNRKYFGISFAILHLIHLLALIVLQYSFHPVFEQAATFSLLAGGLAYVFTILMLLTSFERFAKMISRKSWKLLHKVGAYWIMVVFFTSYLKRVLSGEVSYWFFFILLIGVLLIRFFAFLKLKKRAI